MKLSSFFEARYHNNPKFDYFVFAAVDFESTPPGTAYTAVKMQELPEGVYEEPDPEDGMGSTYGVPASSIKEGVRRLQQLFPDWPSPWEPSVSADKDGLWNNEYHDPPTREDVLEWWERVQ